MCTQESIQLLRKGKRFADAIQEKNIPYFDIAYQGFASGSLDADAYSISLFVDHGLELLVAQSYSKKLGLVKIQLKRLARPMYSNPPVHGARIVANIVRDPNLFVERKLEMELMAGRIKNVRRRLHENLSQKDKRRSDWSYILKQIGMSSYTGLNKAQMVCKLKVESMRMNYLERASHMYPYICVILELYSLTYRDDEESKLQIIKLEQP
ncbi:unnamed protein product [Musa hybrid cultivar]